MKDPGYRDAHTHLQDPRLAAIMPGWPQEAGELCIQKTVVNGTRPEDWDHVADLARQFPNLIIPSFGLHPWHVGKEGTDWNARLTDLLDEFPTAGVGECGLDRWIEGHDLPAQERVFHNQLELATEKNRPVSIHCLRAWGRMLEMLNESPLPEVGFLLHSYGGSREMVPEFVELGGYFSFCGYFLGERKHRIRDSFEAVPEDRLLIETDAPDQSLPEDLDDLRLMDGDQRINHPGNLLTIYDWVTSLREMPLAALKQSVAENFERLFESK